MSTIKDAFRTVMTQAFPKPLGKADTFLKQHKLMNAGGFHIGVSASGNPVIAIALSARPPTMPKLGSSMAVSREGRAGGGWFVIIELTDLSLFDVFVTLSEDILDHCSKALTPNDLHEALVFRLERWKALFSTTPNGRLSYEACKGLFGELMFFRHAVKTMCVDLSVITSSWIGPQGGAQDFLLPNMAVEVKSVLPDAESVKISSLHQLSSSLPIYLFIYDLELVDKSVAKGESLRRLIYQIQQLYESKEHLDAFNSKLMSAGYVDIDYYDEICLAASRHRAYKVASDFPRLTRPDVPKEIDAVSYTLNLRSIERFIEKGI